MIKLSEIPLDKPLTIITHKDAATDLINDVPDVVSIDCFATESFARGVSAESWEQIKVMPGFIKPFRMVFTDLDLPDGVPLQQHGAGVRHITGLICLTYLAIRSGKRPMWVKPETHIHPSSQTGLADLIAYFTNIYTKGTSK